MNWQVAQIESLLDILAELSGTSTTKMCVALLDRDIHNLDEFIRHVKDCAEQLMAEEESK